MKITKLSNNFTPLNQGVYFDIDTEDNTPTTLMVEIIDTSTAEVIATQQLREVTSAKVNIAPYLPRFEDYNPVQNCCTSLSEVPYAQYNIRVEDIESESVTVSVNKIEMGEVPIILTAMPLSRRITRGECDEVLVLTDCDCNISAKITSDTGEQLYIEHYSEMGATRLAISTADFGTDIQTLDIVLYCEGEMFGTLHYSVVPALKSATRLAWLSDKGSIEQYTFPISHKANRAVERRDIVTSEGVKTAHCRTRHNNSLASRFEPAATIAALAQIISATKVWVVDGVEARGVEVTSHTIEQDIFGTPESICIDISTLNEEEVVW